MERPRKRDQAKIGLKLRLKQNSKSLMIRLKKQKPQLEM